MNCSWPTNCPNTTFTSEHPYCYHHQKIRLAVKQLELKEVGLGEEVLRNLGANPVELGTQPRNPEYVKILDEMRRMHESKSHDYARDSDVFSNFKVAAYLADLFTDPVDKVFVTLIGVKIARLGELLSVMPNGERKIVRHESILDTFIDGPNYFAIWGSYRETERKKRLDATLREKFDSTCMSGKQDIPIGDAGLEPKMSPENAVAKIELERLERILADSASEGPIKDFGLG